MTSDPWIELTVTRDSHGSRWAPDSRHLLLRRPRVNGHPNTQFVDLFNADANLVRTYQAADEGVWLDGERFVLTAWERYQPGSGDPWVIDYTDGKAPGTSFLGSVSSDELVPLELNLGEAISNGHGALAIYGCLDCSEDRWQPAYQVWTPEGGLTEMRPGYPEAWSPDGTLLRIEHPLGQGPARENWYEIVRWPGLDTFYADPDVHGLLIDPTWAHAAVFSEGNTLVIDLATGNVIATIDELPMGDTAWDEQGRLIVGDYHARSVTAHDPDGTPSVSWDDVGNTINASDDGSTLAFWDFDGQVGQPAVISLIRDDEVRRVTTPGQMSVGPGPVLSPNGQRLLVFCWAQRGLTAFLLEP